MHPWCHVQLDQKILDELYSRSPQEALRKPSGRPPKAIRKHSRSLPEGFRKELLRKSLTQIEKKLTSKACSVSPGSICISNHLCCRHWFIDILCCWPVWSKSWIKDLASLDMHLSSAPCKSYWQDRIRATYKMKKKCQMEVSITNLTLVICAQKWYFVFKIVLTFCEKKLFSWSRKSFDNRGWSPRIFKNFDITWTIYTNIVYET